jgi:hypothetical protein
VEGGQRVGLDAEARGKSSASVDFGIELDVKSFLDSNQTFKLDERVLGLQPDI